jgi:hypothetical protein
MRRPTFRIQVSTTISLVGSKLRGFRRQAFHFLPSGCFRCDVESVHPTSESTGSPTNLKLPEALCRPDFLSTQHVNAFRGVCRKVRGRCGATPVGWVNVVIASFCTKHGMEDLRSDPFQLSFLSSNWLSEYTPHYATFAAFDDPCVATAFLVGLVRPPASFAVYTTFRIEKSKRRCGLIAY